MRILLVSDEFGRPENTGYRRRVAHLLRALETIGEVHWVVLAKVDPVGLGAPGDVAAHPTVVPVRRRPRGVAAAQWFTSRTPWRHAMVDVGATRRALAAAMSPIGQVDVVVVTRVDNELLSAPLLAAACGSRGIVAVDVDDLESHKLAHQLDVHGGAGLRVHVRRLVHRVDRRRWARLERDLAARRITFVCSELDRHRLDDRSVVVPNAAPSPPAGYVHRPDRTRPVLVFVGSMTYEPNLDAVEYAAREILPLVRATAPDAVLRVVGRGGSARLDALAGTPGLELVGEVEDVAVHLATAHLSLVPLRFGGGTRVKILEAFAHGVPVVSTRVGAEGLDVRDHVHCLLADDAAALAAACIEVLDDPVAAARLAGNGRRLVEERYTAAAMHRAVTGAIRAAVQTRSRTAS